MGEDKSFDARALLYADGKLDEVLTDREATKLADRARELANAPQEERVEVLDEVAERPVAHAPIYRDADGALTYEPGDGLVQQYAVGDEVRAEDEDAVKALGTPPAPADSGSGGGAVKATPAPANKRSTRAADK